MSRSLLLLLLLAAPFAARSPDALAGERADSAAVQGVIELDGPRRLRRKGGHYRLVKDVVANHGGFLIDAPGITLDLGGHTLTYGGAGTTAYGVSSRFQYHEGTITVRNGRIVQAAGAGGAGHAVDFEGGHDIHLEHLEIDVHGPDACGIQIQGTPTGSVLIRECTVACRTTTVTNRHYPGVAAIRLEAVNVATEIVDNRVTASPQWGIQVDGKGEKTACRIHRNTVTGTKALVANGYMIGVHRRNVEVFDNVLEGESRGIHVDGVDHHGNDADIHHNRIRAQDQPNAEFDPHWCHGIKLEGTVRTKVHHNFVQVVADATHSESRALDVDARNGGPLAVYANRFEGVSRVPDKQGKALLWTGLEPGKPGGVDIRHNVFVATDVFVNRTWHSDRGVRFRANAWLPDPAAHGRPLPLFERWDNRDHEPSRGHGFVDPHAPRGTTRASEWAQPGPYASTRERTVYVLARSGDEPAGHAKVRLLDRERREVFAGTTDAQGEVAAPIVVSRLANGPRIDYRGPFTIEVMGAGAAKRHSWTLHVRGPATLRVDVGSGRFERLSLTPSAPRRLRAVGAPHGRARVSWHPPTTKAKVVRYLVLVDGRAWLLADTTQVELGGLDPARGHEIQVQAIAGDGRVSEPSQAVRIEVDDG